MVVLLLVVVVVVVVLLELDPEEEEEEEDGKFSVDVERPAWIAARSYACAASTLVSYTPVFPKK